MPPYTEINSELIKINKKKTDIKDQNYQQERTEKNHR